MLITLTFCITLVVLALKGASFPPFYFEKKKHTEYLFDTRNVHLGLTLLLNALKQPFSEPPV